MYYNVKATYLKDVAGRGQQRVTEAYLVEAESISGAEKTLAEYLEGFPQLKVTSVSNVPIWNIVATKMGKVIYKVGVAFITVTKKGTEKKRIHYDYVEGTDIIDALDIAEKNKDQFNSEIHSIAATKFVGILSKDDRFHTILNTEL